MTTTIKKARAAGLFSLALLFAGFAAYPAQALQLVEKPVLGSGMESGKSYDCDTRNEVKWAFKEYGLRHIDVSKTHDYYIYRVSGMIEAKKIEAAVTREENFSGDELLKTTSKSDWVRYVVLYDGCAHEIVKQLQPRLEAM